MEEVDKNIIQKIMSHHIEFIMHKRTKFKHEILKLRLVNKKWKRAIESYDYAWTLAYGKMLQTPESKHRSDILCTGMKKDKVWRNRDKYYACTLVTHYTNIIPESIIKFNFIFFASKLKKIQNSHKRRLKKAKIDRNNIDKIIMETEEELNNYF